MIRNRYVLLTSLFAVFLVQVQSPSPKALAADSPPPSQTRTFRGELLGISFAFPKSLAVIPLESPEMQHSRNDDAWMNRDPECRNTIDQALLAIRDVPLPSDNSRENLTNRTGMEDRPDGNIASVGEQEAAPLFPEDFNPSVMNSPWLQKR